MANNQQHIMITKEKIDDIKNVSSEYKYLYKDESRIFATGLISLWSAKRD